MKKVACLLVGLVPLAGARGGIPALETNRVKTIALFEENIYGRRPDFTSFVKTCKVVGRECNAELNAVRLDVAMNVMTPLGETNFTAVALIPEISARRRVPCFVYVSFDDPDAILRQRSDVKCHRWPVSRILNAGFATVAFDYQGVFPDRTKDIAAWGASTERTGDSWGAISAWALAASRVMDWIETVDEIDSAKVAIIGHSRLGKTALWAGVTDRRFAYTVVNDSGCLGARVSACNLCGETIEQITRVFPHWFAPNCAARFAGRDGGLPFDQHWLIAAVAPRIVSVGSAEDDHWACPSGEHAGLDLARPAWGKEQDKCHYHIRPGGHDITAVDWQDYMSFAKKFGW